MISELLLSTYHLSIDLIQPSNKLENEFELIIIKTNSIIIKPNQT